MHIRLATHRIVLICNELQIKLVRLHSDMYLSYDIVCWYYGIIMAQRSVAQWILGTKSCYHNKYSSYVL